jgi:hypothetical protein
MLTDEPGSVSRLKKELDHFKDVVATAMSSFFTSDGGYPACLNARWIAATGAPTVPRQMNLQGNRGHACATSPRAAMPPRRRSKLGFAPVSIFST